MGMSNDKKLKIIEKDEPRQRLSTCKQAEMMFYCEMNHSEKSVIVAKKKGFDHFKLFLLWQFSIILKSRVFQVLFMGYWANCICWAGE